MKDSKNPFSVTTPEDLSANDVKELFVDVFTDFQKVLRSGHVFIHGPRGCGKSMIFRYLQPDCQILAQEKNLKELDFYSIYIPLKSTQLKITDLDRLENRHSSDVINEHFMLMYTSKVAFKQFSDICKNHLSSDYDEEVKDFAHYFINLLRDCGFTKRSQECFKGLNTGYEYIKKCEEIADLQFRFVITYAKKLGLTFKLDKLPFEGPITGFSEFLYPLIKKWKSLSFMPDNQFFLLFDDAHNLSVTQCKILNTWVSLRTTDVLSIKISTQMLYHTYYTTDGYTIDVPHDYSEINVSTIYTSSYRNKYLNRVKKIVHKRLLLNDIHVDPKDFFPPDEEQEKKIENISKKIRGDWESKGKGYNASDDVKRYARPNYMKSLEDKTFSERLQARIQFFKELSSTKKASSKYSYSGLNQLVHISSGIIRNFLDAASIMYSDTLSQLEDADAKIFSIPPKIQNQVVREQSDELIYNKFDKQLRDKSVFSYNEDELNKLFNLIYTLGGTFREILLSDKSERRVFSIAFSDNPNKELLDVLELGIHLGYFHESSIGNKLGRGRTKLYILNRMLAPHFNLDPTSFSAYLFVNSKSLLQAMNTPDKFLRRIKNKGLDEYFEQNQLHLF